MPLLILTTLLWAFSFSLIGVYLAGQVDGWFAVLARTFLACLVFLPFLRWRNYSSKQIASYMIVGAIQLGLMYLFYYQSFLYLSVPEVLLFTIFTPIYVTLIYDIISHRPLRKGYLFSAFLAVIGAAIIRYDSLSPQFLTGLLLIQGSNICFAFGQVSYKRLMQIYPMPQLHAFSWFYVGALIISFISYYLFSDFNKFPQTTLQWGILLWLGVGASGLGYFMWNYGATKVDSGSLAIMNNALIPTGLLVNFIIWQQSVDWLRLFIGGGVIVLSIFVHHYLIEQKSE